MLGMNELAASREWKKLQEHWQTIADLKISSYFDEDPQRFQRFSLSTAGITLDYSKNRIVPETIDLLMKLAMQRRLQEKINDLMSGAIVNRSENRPALHTALRNLQNTPVYVEKQNIMPEVGRVLEKMGQISTTIRHRQLLGYSGEAIDTIVHFGIGGSDLGPLMAFAALEAFVDKRLQYHFFSHQDESHVQAVLSHLNPAKTLIIIASKSFTTSETLANAEIAKQWLLTAARHAPAAAAQMIAVTCKTDRAVKFGIQADQVLPVWEWVGGRYSVWSAMSLIVAIAIGPDHFREFLAGAEAMDQHFRQAELRENMPVILGLLDIWYNNFLGRSNRAIIPYSRILRYFPDHLQQVYMESLGKRVDELGHQVNYPTGFVIWGGTGTNSQHSFHQLLLQGNQWVPVDFILPADNLPLAAHCLAQSQVLMNGYSESQIRSELKAQGLNETTISELVPQQMIPGNCPSHTLVLSKITPYNLGSLLALYEHRIYVSSVIWGINAFDQWGVERGKTIAKQILADLHTPSVNRYDASTNGLLDVINQLRKNYG